MFEKFLFRSVVALAAVVLLMSTAQAVDIETVPVGNQGNDRDTRYATPGYGGVSYTYRMGKYEVTAGQFRDFLNAVDPTGTNTDGLYNSSMDTDSYGCQITWNSNSSTYDFSGAPSGTEADWADRSVNYVSWYDAAMFANWLNSGNIHHGAYDTSSGANWGDPNASNYTGITAHDSDDMDALVSTYGTVYVIPTEDEWHKAAYHQNDGVTANYFDYPTSSNTLPAYVNDSGNLSGTGTPFTDGVTDPGNYATYDGDYGTDGIGGPYYRTEVREWENSDSPYGTFDQGGNVWEWNEAILSNSSRGLRGGAFINVGGKMRAKNRNGSPPASEVSLVGFRVASVPEPGSITLLACGLVVGLMWWRVRR